MATKKPAAKTPAGSVKKRQAVTRTSESAKRASTEANRTAWSVVLVAMALLLLCLFVIPGKEPWEAVGDFFFGVFGVASWILCILLVYTAFLLALDVGAEKISAKVWQMAILAAFICSLFFTAKYGAFDLTYSDALKLGWEAKQGWGGGWFGALIGWPISRFGKTPAIIIEVVVTLAVFAIMSGKGVINIINMIRKAREKNEVRRVENGKAPVLVDGYEIPAEATAASQLGKKPKFNTDVKFDDNNKIPIQHAQPVKSSMTPPAPLPEPNPQQLASLEAAIANLNSPYKKGDIKFEDHPLKGDTLPIPGTEIPAEIDSIAEKATAQVAEQEAKSATSSEYKPVKDLNYKSPPINLLTAPQPRDTARLNDELRITASRLVDALLSFGVETRVINICCGPTVTRYELQPAAGVKISKITNLSNDIALSLAAQSVRIEAPIPGKNAIGIEIPNKTVSTVNVREVMESDKFATAPGNLTVALGKDITGNSIVTDLSKMPHLLIAGTTGSGKSVCINTFLISLIYKSKPEDVRMLLIDPKVVELNVYNGIPHLLIPVVTDPKKAAGALAWAVNEMMDRYKLFAAHDVRDLTGYNEMAKHTPGIDTLPQVVVVIDELSDLMMVARTDVEDSVCRLAQMARAAGMHLVIATQRPSTDVITGVIKANIPSRIAFAVSSQVDSRVIMDSSGAEKLLGRGDMLFCPIGTQKPVRIQGCFVSDAEVERVIDYVKNKHGANYDADIEQQIELAAAQRAAERGDSGSGGDEPVDDMLTQAIDCVVDAGGASTSLLQRKLRIGYGRAARIIDEMEERGIIGGMDGSKPRAVLITRQQWAEMKMRSQDK
ncbi:MAG TPA: DNA translocase FtsK [Oscillospiraceae bacterium]|nr:DNA translocase FtsK [Oscillospiraceae bacterium]HPK36487.1 DNA translocase FtsK [Oscillospiraceae bacterium]HPR76453.1 DNA translocase FtsK [Oscillospiraceae bacterium]